MDEILRALAAQQAELAGLLAGRTDADWRRLSPCQGWTVADVVLHLAQTNELAIASAEGYLGEIATEFGAGPGSGNVDDTAALMVSEQRDAPIAELHKRWQSGADTLQSVLAAGDPHERVQWVAGQLSLQTLATTRLAETWIHTGDVAEAFGVELEPTDRLRHVARLAWRTIPYAFERSGRQLHGPVAFELRGPTGDEWSFIPDAEPVTVVRGDGVELCMVAGRRADPTATGLHGEGPDVDAVLELVRTYAL